MREALRAGIYPASNATNNSNRVMLRKVAPSVALVPYRRDAMRSAIANDATVPAKIPISARSSVFPMTAKLHSSLACSQGHADTDFLCSLRDRIGDHAVNSQGSQDQTQPGKNAHQQNEEPARRNRMIHQPLDRPELCRRLCGIDLPQGTHHASSKRFRRQLGAHHQLRSLWSKLRRSTREIHLPTRIAFDTALVNIRHHSNDASIHAARLRHAADGILVPAKACARPSH